MIFQITHKFITKPSILLQKTNIYTYTSYIIYSLTPYVKYREYLSFIPVIKNKNFKKKTLAFWEDICYNAKEVEGKARESVWRKALNLKFFKTMIVRLHLKYGAFCCPVLGAVFLFYFYFVTHPPTPMASVRAVMCMPKPTKNVKSSSKKW